MRLRTEILLSVLLFSSLMMIANANSLRRIKRQVVEKQNTTNPLKKLEEIKDEKELKKETAQDEKKLAKVEGQMSIEVVKKDASTGLPNQAEKATTQNSTDPVVALIKTQGSAKANKYEDGFDEVQKVWQNLEARSRHHYEPYSWLGYEPSLHPFAPAIHRTLPTAFIPELNHIHQYHHPSPFAFSRIIPKRHTRSKKKALGKKRKTVLVLHTPANFNDTENKNFTEKLTKEETEEVEAQPFNDGHLIEHVRTIKTHDAEPIHTRPVRFFDYPQYQWESPRLSFEEHFGGSRVKHLDPTENLFKLADMMINKIKTDSQLFSDIGPYHTQTTHISATPDLVISTTANTKHNMDKLNELTPYGMKTEGDTTYGTLEFTPPLQLTNHPSEPKKLFSIIENALDSVGLDHDGKEGGEEEIEVHCPIHHKKGETSNIINAKGDHELANKNDVYEVCQCHFVKKSKDDK